MGLTVKGTIEEMHHLAKSKGGTCRSVQYINSKTKLVWECKYGHQWRATPLSVKHRSSWCPVCANNLPIGLDVMKNIALSNGGQCLSEKYRNVKTKLRWQCSDGHIFYATAVSVRKGVWCTECERKES